MANNDEFWKRGYNNNGGKSITLDEKVKQISSKGI